MDRLPSVSPEKLKGVLHGLVDDLAEQIMAGVNAARPGNLLNDSEEPVRQAGHEFLRVAFEAAVQQKIDAAEAAFPPSGLRDDRSGDKAAGPQADGQQRPAVPHDSEPVGSGEGGPAVVARARRRQRRSGR